MTQNVLFVQSQPREASIRRKPLEMIHHRSADARTHAIRNHKDGIDMARLQIYLSGGDRPIANAGNIEAGLNIIDESVIYGSGGPLTQQRRLVMTATA